MDEVRPFAGIEVVEFGQFIAVPFCAQLLSEGGAHVVKIESLEGDPVRHLAPLAPGETRHFISRNRGKHTLPLDLRHPAAAPVVERLVARADVVLTNFRPGLAAELGLDAPSLTARYPRLIVGNVSAFGARGPDAQLAGMDLVIQARSGLMATMGQLQNDLPAGGQAPIADYTCALSLSFAIASALFRRERTGRGGEVEVALLMAALLLQNNSMLRVEAPDGPVHAKARQRLSELRAAGRPYTEQATVMPTIRTPAMTNVYYRVYATRDAAVAVACVSPGLQRAFMRALGLSDAGHAGPVADPPAYYAALRAKAEAVFASRTADEWKPVFDAHGVPAAAVRLPLELIDDEQAVANGFVHDLPHPSLGTIRVLAPPARLDGPGFVAAEATPAFGSEARSILGSLGFDDDDIEKLITADVTTEQYAPRRRNGDR